MKNIFALYTVHFTRENIFLYFEIGFIKKTGGNAAPKGGELRNVWDIALEFRNIIQYYFVLVYPISIITFFVE